jgi:hypothetical protein
MLSDALETVTLQGFQWARFRPLKGPSTLLTCDAASDVRFATAFDSSKASSTTATPSLP